MVMLGDSWRVRDFGLVVCAGRLMPILPWLSDSGMAGADKNGSICWLEMRFLCAFRRSIRYDVARSLVAISRRTRGISPHFRQSAGFPWAPRVADSNLVPRAFLRVAMRVFPSAGAFTLFLAVLTSTVGRPLSGQ